MVETQEKVIDGVTYMVTQFPARMAIRIQARLVKLLGPALATLVAGRGPDDTLDLNALGPAVERLCAVLDPDDLENLILELLKSTRRDSKEISGAAAFDAAFSGNIATVYKVVAFVLEVNFKDFFGLGGIGNLAAKLGGKVPVSPSA